MQIPNFSLGSFPLTANRWKRFSVAIHASTSLPVMILSRNRKPSRPLAAPDLCLSSFGSLCISLLRLEFALLLSLLSLPDTDNLTSSRLIDLSLDKPKPPSLSIFIVVFCLLECEAKLFFHSILSCGNVFVDFLGPKWMRLSLWKWVGDNQGLMRGKAYN